MPLSWIFEVCHEMKCTMMFGADTAFLGRHSYQMQNGQNLIRNLKRHSDGTFSSDFTHYLDKIKAKDFVEWLASTKREGWAKKQCLNKSCKTLQYAFHCRLQCSERMMWEVKKHLLFKAGEQDDRFQPWAKTGSCKISDRLEKGSNDFFMETLQCVIGRLFLNTCL